MENRRTQQIEAAWMLPALLETGWRLTGMQTCQTVSCMVATDTELQGESLREMNFTAMRRGG